MGGIVECGVSVDTKASPRRAAIEKAQEELRQEYDVREERRRELEFLEKGGNPLDFNLGHVASLSVQSTSLTDQIAEQNVISEAKGSFALTASPHGDSVESSGKLGSSLGREPNTADNLMLLDGDNSNIGGERIVKHGTKRTNTAQPEQSLQTDGNHNNAKEAEDSGTFRHGAKSQAYARRNRSKSSRDGPNIPSIKSSAVPRGPYQKDAEGVIQEPQAEDHGASSISNSKAASPNCNNISKTAASDDMMAVEIGGVQTAHEGKNTIKNQVVEGENESKASETLPNAVDDNQLLSGGETAAACTPSAAPDIIAKEAISTTTHSSEKLREICVAEKADVCHSDRSNVDVDGDVLNSKSLVPECAVEPANVNKKNPASADTTRTVDPQSDRNENLLPMKLHGRSDEDPNNDIPSDKHVSETGQLEVVRRPNVVEDNSSSIQAEVSDAVHVKDEMEVSDNVTAAEKNTGQFASPDHEKVNKEGCSDWERKDNCSSDYSAHKLVLISGTSASPIKDVPHAVPSVKSSMPKPEGGIQSYGGNQTKMAKKEYEDSILRKARIIEVNLKRAGELSACNLALEKRQKCHWDFVLEEMAWMANDFMQERLWKSTAAAQVCHTIASSGRAKFEEANIQRKQKSVARSLAKDIMKFWRSAEILRTSGEMPNVCNSNVVEKKLTGAKSEKEQGVEPVEDEKSRRLHQSPIQDYALRFLRYSSSASESLVLAEAPHTPDRANDFGILKLSDQLSEESLFYTVAPGAMLAYRESVESQFVYHKNMDNTVHNEDFETSMCDSVADVPRENPYEEDEGETYTCALPGMYDSGSSVKLIHKKNLMQQNMNGARHYDIGTDVPCEPCLESRSGNQPVLSNGKRSSGFLAIPTKRIRSAARPRVVGPFSTGVVGTPQVTSKTDVSSGDTNSYQDDQSSLPGGSLPRKIMDIESTVDFDRQLLCDGTEVSTKSKKKKKPKYSGYKTSQGVADSCALMAPGKGPAYDQRFQVDTIAQYEQKDYLKKRSETHQFDSNGNIVVNGQHAAKKPKLMKQDAYSSQDAHTPAGPLASPVASQMSNMANPTKIIKIITNRDRGRKTKILKMAAGHSGSGSPWSNFEDQALVVLVHDMGQNWELVSDAINSIVQFKCIYRRPKECKERHKFLMDKSSGDGADSAEDSGSSQHYQSTLPGIPKGSARQLFQRLQGPFEEETLKTHFEKIIFLAQQLRSSRRQGDGQELKPITQAHSSHNVALSQACPNYLSGGTLTPLDLCDAITPNSDALSLGYQGATNGLPLPNHHSSISPILPTSNLNSRLPGSPGMVLGSNLPSPSATLNAPPRDAQRYGMPRPTSLHGDEQQRIQQYNQMLNGRNLQQPGVSVPGALPSGVDRGVRMMPGAHGMGMMTGLNRGMPVARPGFPRLNSPGMLNMVPSGNMLPNSGQGMQNSVNVHPSAISGPGNQMLRPRDPMQMLRPGQNLEEHRQMMMQELQMQVSQGNNQAVHFTGMNPPFSSAAASSPVQSFSAQQPQQPHQMSQQSHVFGNPHHPHMQGTNHSSPHPQAYAIRMAKERQIQQRMLTQQQHPFSGASAVPAVQNGSHIQQQSQAPAAPLVPTSQSQHKQQHSAQNPPDSSGLTSQAGNATQHKQKKQQGQQQSKQNQQQRNQGSQQAKLMKSLGRGNMLMHQNPPADVNQASAFPTPSKNQVPDKNVMQQGPGYFPGSTGLLASLPQPGNNCKVYTSPLPQSSTQMPLIPSQPDVGNQGLAHGSPSQTLLPPQQPPVHSSLPLAAQPPPPPSQRHMNTSKNNIQRMMMQQNRQMNSDGRIESPIDQVQHNQMIPTTSTQCADSGSPGISSVNQRKQEPSYDTTAVTSTSQSASSPQETFVGNETLLPSSSEGMLQRQMSGSVPMHGPGIGGQWQQQQSRQQLQSQQQQQPQHQHRTVVQGSVYSHTSDSGPG